MIRKCLAILLFVSAFNVQAGIALDFQAATVPELIEVVVKRILRRDYVLGPGISGQEPKITLSVANIEPDAVLPLVSNALGEHGITVDASGPIVRVVRGVRPGAVGGSMYEISSAVPVLPVAVSPGQKTDTAVAVAPGRKQDIEAFEVYWPKFRSVETLAHAVRFLGVEVGEGKGGALVYGGDRKAVDRVRDLLGRLDRRPGSVDVRAMIVEYSDTGESGQSFGGALSILAGKLQATIAAGNVAANQVRLAGASLSLVASAVAGDSRFRQLAEPRLRVLDGARARIVVGNEFPVRGRVETDKGGNAVAGIEYKQAGIVFELVPTITDEAVLLNVKQQLSSVSVTTTSGIDSPTVNKREAETSIDARPGELIVIAGLDDSRESATSSGLSFLPAALRGKSESRQRTQVMLLIEAEKLAL